MPAETTATVPQHPNDVTPQWLTARLREVGILPRGQVTSFDAKLPAKWNRTQAARLTLQYDAKAPAAAPRNLFLKVADPDGGSLEDPCDEITFYQTFYREDGVGGLPLIRCYAALRDEASRFTCLLLDDLSETHAQPGWPLPPSIAQCGDAVTALARLHAHWWTGADAQTKDRMALLRKRHDAFFGELERLTPGFLDFIGDRLSPERRVLLEKVCFRLSDLIWTRIADGDPFTLLHGDAHFWNIMYPHDPSRHATVVFDWDNWDHGPGPFDLAYMIALHWYRDRRARHEEPLLRRYHEALSLEIGEPYAWDGLMADYRLGCLLNFCIPVMQHHYDLMPGIWWPHLERVFLSYEDLGCADLL